MAEFKLPDPKKTYGKVTGMLLLGGFGLAFYYFLLPILLTIVWGTVQLVVGFVVLLFLLYILLNPTFWKRCKIILDALGEMIFSKFVEMNPFVIMELQIDKSDEDRKQLQIQCEKLKGQEAKLRQSLNEEKEALELAAKKIELLKPRIASNPSDFEAPMQLESATNDWSNSNDYITKVLPVHSDIVQLIIILDKAYVKSGYALKDARNTIKKQRATYEAVTTGDQAMKKALRAFTGDPELNKAGDIALEALKKDISNKVGAIKNSIKLTTEIMNERDLNDAAKISLAVQKAQQIDASFEVVSTTINNPEVVKLPASTNK